MLKSCKYCGRYHRRDEVCPRAPKKAYKYNSTERKYSEKKKDDKYYFRNSQAWRDKRELIRARDLNLCQACLYELPFTEKKYNSERLGVHHVESLDASWDKRLDDDNLITLCECHHKIADSSCSFNDLVKKLLKKITNF